MKLEGLDPTTILEILWADVDAAERVMAYAEDHGVRHVVSITSRVLCEACGWAPRSWWRWLEYGEVPASFARHLELVAFGGYEA